jgi:chromosomal replication initiator protein
MNPYVYPGIGINFTENSIELIIVHVSSFYEVPIDRVFARTRKREVIEARYALIWILGKNMGMSLKKIGKMFNQDHTTILKAQRKVKNLMDVYPDYKEQIGRLIKTIPQI